MRAAGLPARSTEELDRMWVSQLRWWHAVFALLTLVTAVGVLFSGMSPARVVAILACLVGMGAAYAVGGRHGFGAPQDARTVAYVAVVWTLLFVAIALDTNGVTWIMVFVLFPQTWAMLRVRVAIVVTTVVSLGFVVVRLWQSDWEASAIPGIFVGTFLSWSLSILLGLFIVRLIRETEARAAAIDELRDTQAQLAAAERDRGVHEERERLSREIHDTLAQGFTSVITLSRAIDAALARGDVATARDRLGLLEATAAENLSEARLIVAELTPGHLQSRTLVEALDRLVSAVSAESGVDVQLEVAGDPERLGGTTEVVLLRTVQEALSNVRRHAEATRARVTVTYACDRVLLEVDDDGRGYTQGLIPSGFGLDGVRSRAAAVGGVAEVASVPGHGTRLRVEVPR